VNASKAFDRVNYLKLFNHVSYHTSRCCVCIY